MPQRFLLVALLPFSAALLGCATQQYRWEKPGVTGADLAADRHACLVQTEDRFNPFEDFGWPFGPTAPTERSLNARPRYEQPFRDCLQARETGRASCRAGGCQGV